MDDGAVDDGADDDRPHDAERDRRRRQVWWTRARRVIVVGVVAMQATFVIRAYWAPHREFGYQMFPESSQWTAEIFRVIDPERAGAERRKSIRDGWSGYSWNDLVDGRGLDLPWRRHHADSGLGRQLEFLQEALDWVARNTPDDDETAYLEAVVTTWPNLGDPETVILRSVDRDVG